MKSNFEFLKDNFPVLANFGELAEKYLYSDSNSCLMKLGMIGETIVNLIFTYDRIPLPHDNTAVKRIDTLFREGMLPRDLVNILHALRKIRNRVFCDLDYSLPDNHSDCRMDEEQFLEKGHIESLLNYRESYKWEFGDTPFGLLIRKIARLDHDPAMQAFSAFINDQSLNQKQIAFVKKIINHIERNGYMENVSQLTKPPFDKPVGFIKLFDVKTRTALMATINQIRENAVQIVAS